MIKGQPYDVNYLFVRNNRGELIQLDNLIKLNEQATPTTRFRYNRFVSATITAGLTDGYTLGDGIEAMNRVAQKVLPRSSIPHLQGSPKILRKAHQALYLLLSLPL